MEPVSGVVRSQATTLPYPSPEGRVRWFSRVWQKIKVSEFVLSWQIQARLSNPTLAILIATLPFYTGVVFLPLIALSWGVLTCSYYEYRRRHGLECLYRDPNEEAKAQMSESGRHFWGWSGYILKVIFILGPVNVLTTKGLCRLHRHYQAREETETLASRVTMVVGIGKSGVMAARHFLEQAGYPKKKIYRLNLVGRVLEVPFKMADAWILYALYLILPFPKSANLVVHGWYWLVGTAQFVVTGGWL